MNEELLEQLSELEEVFMNEEASPEDVATFFDLWPEIREAIQGLGTTDGNGTYHKPAITEIEALNEDEVIDSVYNLLSDVESTLCQEEYAEQHLQFCREMMELIDTNSDSGFFEQYETGIGKALLDLGQKEEAKMYLESLLQKGPKANYISNALWAAFEMKDTKWLSSIYTEYLSDTTHPWNEGLLYLLHRSRDEQLSEEEIGECKA